MPRESWAERRRREAEYRADVDYEVWRHGGSMDRVDYERVSDHFWAGDSEGTAARHELRRQHGRRQDEAP